jgi:hypothetical protein
MWAIFRRQSLEDFAGESDREGCVAALVFACEAEMELGLAGAKIGREHELGKGAIRRSDGLDPCKRSRKAGARWVVQNKERNAFLGDASLLGGDLWETVTEHGHVVQVESSNCGRGHDAGWEEIGRVTAATDPNFEHTGVDGLSAKASVGGAEARFRILHQARSGPGMAQLEGHESNELEEGRGHVVRGGQVVPRVPKERGELRRFQGLAEDANALANRD